VGALLREVRTVFAGQAPAGATDEDRRRNQNSTLPVWIGLPIRKLASSHLNRAYSFSGCRSMCKSWALMVLVMQLLSERRRDECGAGDEWLWGVKRQASPPW